MRIDIRHTSILRDWQALPLSGKGQPKKLRASRITDVAYELRGAITKAYAWRDGCWVHVGYRIGKYFVQPLTNQEQAA